MVRLQAARRGQVVRESVRSETAAATTVQAALRGRHSRREHGASAYWANGEGVPARAGDTTPEDGVCRGCDRWVRECSCGRHRRRASPKQRHAAEVKRRRANASRSRSPSPSKATASGASTPKSVDEAATALQAASRGAVARRLRREEELRRRGVKSPEHLRARTLGPPGVPNPSRPNPRPTSPPAEPPSPSKVWRSPFAVPDDPRNRPPRPDR